MILNRLKTAVLLALLSGLIMLLGGFMGGTQGVTIAFLFALFINGLMYFFSDKMVLTLYRAQPLDRLTHKSIYDTVEDLSSRMEIPMPKLWIVDMPMANAFATGRNPKNASVVVTQGIVDALEPHELRGVLAHELSHVKNRDILISTIAATLAATIGYLADMMHRMAFWQSISGERKNRDGSPLVMFLIALLMPLAALLIQLAVSRSREFMADETGADATHDPLALASALEKLERHIPEAHLNQEEKVYASTASLFIVHPFCGKGLINLFSTHPSTEKRVARLRMFYEKMIRS